jgi:tetratricopeptide (TPR) repeat protein
MLTESERRAIEKIPTRDVQAYDYYLRGRGVFYELRRKSLEYARQMYARAIVIDPSYAAAYAGVADCSSFLYMWFEASEDNLKEAQHASKRAVELEPDSAEAHASRGTAESLRRHFQDAEREFEIAMRLNPKAYDTHYFYGRCVFAQGNSEKAAALFRRASELDPGDFQSLNHLEMCLRSLGRPEEARKVTIEELARVERYIQLHPMDARALYLGAGSLLQLGDRERCLEWCARALAIDPEENATLYNVACSYSLMGESDRALDLLTTAVNNGFGHKDWIENDPDFTSLREHPRFRTMLKELAAKRS